MNVTHLDVKPEGWHKPITQMMVLANPIGWHLRQASRLVKTAGRFTSHIIVEGCGRSASAKSIVAILCLIAEANGRFSITATGADAQGAIQAISAECLVDDTAGL